MPRTATQWIGWTAATLLPAAARAEATIAPSAQLVKLVSGLAVVVAAILLLSWVLKRLGGAPLSGGTGSAFRVLASLPVGPRERVVLLQAGPRQLLIGVAPGNVRVLQRCDEPLLQVPEQPGGYGSFQQRLFEVLGRRSGA